MRREAAEPPEPTESASPSSGPEPHSEPAASESLLTRPFATLMLSASIYFFGIGSLNSLLPTYVVDELDGTEATSGVVMGSLAITALVTRPNFGRMADRAGARRIMVIGAALAAVSMGVLVMWGSLAGAIVSRLVLGAAGAAFMTGATMLSLDMAPAARRSQAAAFILIAFHAGLGTGPLVAESLRDATSYRTIWTLVAATAIGALAVAMLLPFRPGVEAAVPAPLVHPAALGPGVVTLLGVVAFNGFMTFAPLYAREIGLDDVGIVFAIASFTIVVVRLTLGRVPDVVGPVIAGGIALALTAIAAVVIALWDEPTGMYIGAALVAGGLSLQSPSFMKMAIDGAPAGERGSVMATFGGFYDVANALVGPLLGLTIAGFGYRSAFMLTAMCSVAGLVVLITRMGPRYRRALLA